MKTKHTNPDVALTPFVEKVWYTAARLLLAGERRVSASTVANELPPYFNMWNTGKALRVLVERGYMDQQQYGIHTFVYTMFVFPADIVTEHGAGLRRDSEEN